MYVYIYKKINYINSSFLYFLYFVVFFISYNFYSFLYFMLITKVRADSAMGRV